MPIVTQELTSTQKDVVSNNSSLSSYLEHLLIGRNETPHSWLWENESSDVTLNRWLRILENVRELKDGDTIYNFDYRQVEKFGPQGEVPPIAEGIETLADSYAQYSVDLPAIPDLEIARWIFGPRLQTKRPRGYKAVIANMDSRDTLETNSGWPLFTKRKTVVNQSIRDALSGEAYTYPAIILFRSYNGKLRPVWMYPMSLNLVESSFAQVIQDAVRNSPTLEVRQYVSPWVGFEDVKREFTRQYSQGIYPVGGDATAMDAHFRVEHTNLVFTVVRHLFQKQYWDALERSISQINTIDVVVGPNARLTGFHGLASGSAWTQLVETIYQLIMYYMRSKYLGGQGIGDDFVWFSPVQETDAEIAGYLEQWGLPANPSKQSVDANHCTFLQRLFLRTYYSREDKSILGGIYPTVRALNSLLNPEKFHSPSVWNSDMFCVRCYMILENVVDHPLFEEFVKFVVHGQKDLIPFAKQSFEQLEKAQNAARLITGLVPTYNQEKRSKPLAEFTSVRYAATL